MWARQCLAGIVCDNADIKNIMKILIFICWDTGMLSEPSASAFLLQHIGCIFVVWQGRGLTFQTLPASLMSLSSIFHIMLHTKNVQILKWSVSAIIGKIRIL